MMDCLNMLKVFRANFRFYIFNVILKIFFLHTRAISLFQSYNYLLLQETHSTLNYCKIIKIMFNIHVYVLFVLYLNVKQAAVRRDIVCTAGRPRMERLRCWGALTGSTASQTPTPAGSSWRSASRTTTSSCSSGNMV